jgi:hypothetical protein
MKITKMKNSVDPEITISKSISIVTTPTNIVELYGLLLDGFELNHSTPHQVAIIRPF